MANPSINDIILTHDESGNVIEVYPLTKDFNVEGYQHYYKGARVYTIEEADVTEELNERDDVVYFTKGDGYETEAFVVGSVISDAEISAIWNISDAEEKDY